MKTKKLFFALVLTLALVFTSEAQIVQSFAVENWPGDVDFNTSPNKEWVAIAGDNLQIFYDGNGNPYVDGTFGDNGWWKKFHRNVDKTYSLIEEGPLYKGTGGSASVGIEEYRSVSVSNTGLTYIYFDSDIAENTIVKDGVVAHVLTSAATQSEMRQIDNHLYMVIGDNISWCELWKVDIATNQVIYQTSYPAGIGKTVTSIQKMPDGNLAIGFLVTPDDQEIQKFDEATGANIGFIKLVDRYALFKFNNNNEMELMTADDLNRGQILTGSSFDQLVNETNFPVNNLFSSAPPKDWKTSNGILYNVNSAGDFSYAFTLDKKMRHGYQRPLFFYNQYGSAFKSYVYDENEYLFVVKDGDNYSILNIVDDGGDPVATVNLSNTDILDGRDGMTYDGGWLQDYTHVSTLVFADNNMPNVGDTPEENWLNAPVGYINYGATSVKDSIVDNKTLLFYDVQYNSDWRNAVRMRIFLKSETQLSVGDVLDIKTVMYPNPTSEILNFTTPQKIENIAIYNIKGQKVLEKEFEYLNNENEYQIDISKLTKGTYLAKIKGKFGVKIRKFMVK